LRVIHLPGFVHDVQTKNCSLQKGANSAFGIDHLAQAPERSAASQIRPSLRRAQAKALHSSVLAASFQFVSDPRLCAKRASALKPATARTMLRLTVPVLPRPETNSQALEAPLGIRFQVTLPRSSQALRGRPARSGCEASGRSGQVATCWRSGSRSSTVVRTMSASSRRATLRSATNALRCPILSARAKTMRATRCSTHSSAMKRRG
jgi:hypothetical protein